MPPIHQLLWQLIRYAQRLYWVDTLLWLFILGLPAVPGILIRGFFDSLTDHAHLGWSPWGWIGLLLATGLARVVAIFTGRITKTQHRFLISGLVRHNLLVELLKRPGAELATGGANGRNTSPGEILSYFRDDAFQIEDTVVGTNEIFAAGVFAVGSVALLLSVNPTMTLLVFLPLCAIATLAQRAEHRLKRYRRASRQATQQVTGLIGEMFTAVQAVKVAGAEPRMLEELQDRCDRRRRLMVRDQVFSAILDSGFESIVSLGTGLILLLASQSLGTQGTLTVGDFALFVYYLSFVTYFLAFFGGFLATTKQSEVSFERMAGLIGAGEEARGRGGESNPNEIVESQPPSDPPTQRPTFPLTQPHPLYLKPILGFQPPLPSPLPATASESLQALRVEGLTYYYPGSANGITDISFTLQRGSLVVITGRIGSGKTTLLRVLLGLLPKQSGSIFWNGQPVDDPANVLVPPRAAYTPQIPQLFSTSLRENLLLGLDAANASADLESAIATAVFDQDVATMPDGLDTLIGTRGVRLSGGQKQRAAAARMLLRQPELLVFDDLSSALDVETEQRLWARLLGSSSRGGEWGSGGVMEGGSHRATPLPHHPVTPALQPTLLIVSHRRAVLNQADWVMLLEAGNVTFSGKPVEFWHQCPGFWQDLDSHR
ncbi:ABC-type multidrug transport system [Halomicronema hongdechloris C2206]|uniref:ABC-type multidrug transport system n=1 Tax=Halomicronema hongdechloris C2206 TaxID=1641165 RepID=A0A1Z3HN50_9CYAN|nr:ABC transporter ATP-binding protein [Halomicronema hongdechloris]ASC71744.1 ABC-type multidrug transport system [Halomicronema hongdechloris C2206]